MEPSVIQLNYLSFVKKRSIIIHAHVCRWILLLFLTVILLPLIIHGNVIFTLGGGLLAWLLAFLLELYEVRYSVQEVRFSAEERVLELHYSVYNRLKVKQFNLDDFKVEFSHATTKTIEKKSTCSLKFSSGQFSFKVFDTAENNVENFSRMLSAGIISMNYNSRAFLKKCSQSEDIELKTLVEPLLG